jgi:RIO-like serine/threonine protein kinase
MAAMKMALEIAPENLRLLLLAYGMDNAYRIVSLENIAQSLPQIDREQIREGLNRLVEEGLVSRFTGRYCFNKPLSKELRSALIRVITPSGTLRVKKTA